MFGSDSADWRMRYADGGRTIVEWRDPSIDPARDRRLDNGFFSAFGEPECKLMGVEHQWAAQRDLSAPPTSYTVVGPRGDPWLAAAGLAPGDVIPGVVGYEWDSLVPGCFAGQVVPLMTAVPAGIRRRPPQRGHDPGNRAERRPRVRDGHDGAGLGAR